MKCKLCGTSAYYKPSYLKYWLCEKHFTEYFEKRVLKLFSRPGFSVRNRKILVAVSGGKDSASLLHMLSKNRNTLGYADILAVHINLGINNFSEMVESVVKDTTSREGVPLLLINMRDLLGMGLAELSRRARRSPCSVCGLIKRYILNIVAEIGGFDIVMTGHHLDDTLRFMLKDIITYDTYSLKGLRPVVISVNKVFRIKPLTSVYEDDIKAYVKATGLKHVETFCPFKHIGDVERTLNIITQVLEENIPGGKIVLYRNICRLIEEHIGHRDEDFSRCRCCNSPSRGDECGFCKLTRKVFGEPRGGLVKTSIAKIINDLCVKR